MARRRGRASPGVPPDRVGQYQDIASISFGFGILHLECFSRMPVISLCLLWLCSATNESVLPYVSEPVIRLNSGAAAGSAPLEPLRALPVFPLFPIAPPSAKPQPPTVEWAAIGRGSLRFLAVMQAFRYATEEDTRRGGIGLGPAYLRSVTSLHGWADGRSGRDLRRHHQLARSDAVSARPLTRDLLGMPQCWPEIPRSAI